MNTTEEKVKPEKEYFFGVLYKIFCGKCYSLIDYGWKYRTEEDAKRYVTECPHCNTKVDWD